MDGSEKAKTDLEREQIAAKIKDCLKQAQTPFEDFVDPRGERQKHAQGFYEFLFI